MSARSELALMEWQAGAERLEQLDVGGRREAVFRSVVDEIVAELRRRMGQVYTVSDLVAEYETSAAWCRHVAQMTTDQVWAHDLTIVQDAAFARIARDAADYRP